MLPRVSSRIEYILKEDPRRPSELRVGAVLSYAVIAVQFTVAMIYTPIMLRFLGQSEYGLYSLVGSIVSYLALLSFGFGGAYLRFYARLSIVEDWEGVRRLNGIFLLVHFLMGIAAVAGGVFLTSNVRTILGGQFSTGEIETARMLFGILVVNLAITFPGSVFSAYITAQERFVFRRLVELGRAVVSPLVILPILSLGFKSVGMAIATTAVNVAFTTWTVIFAVLKLKMRFSFRNMELSLFREVSTFSSYIFLNMVVDQINWNVDKFIIGRFHGAVPVSVYGVAALINGQYMMMSTAISSVLKPRVNAMVAAGQTDDAFSELFIRVGRIQFLVLGLVLTGFMFFGRPFIELWAGAGYGEAHIIALLLMSALVPDLIQNLGIEIQRAKNMHQFRTWIYIAVAVGNILLSIPLTQRYAGLGAAASTAIAVVIGTGFIMNWYYAARVGLDIKRFWRQILRLSRGMIPALVLGVVVTMTLELNAAMLLGAGFFYVLVYVAGMWWLAMNAYERSVVASPTIRVVRRLSELLQSVRKL